jgi:hypothetical protein
MRGYHARMKLIGELKNASAIRRLTSKAMARLNELGPFVYETTRLDR